MAKTAKRKAVTDAAAPTAPNVTASGAGGTAPLKKKAGGWTRSSMTASKLDGYRRDGWLPSAALLPARVPGAEVSPQPREGERVCFHDFVNRGFSFPVHDFVRALMYAYKVQLHYFTPNSMLHIDVFLCFVSAFWGFIRIGVFGRRSSM